MKTVATAFKKPDCEKCEMMMKKMEKMMKGCEMMMKKMMDHE